MRKVPCSQSHGTSLRCVRILGDDESGSTRAARRRRRRRRLRSGWPRMAFASMAQASHHSGVGGDGAKRFTPAHGHSRSSTCTGDPGVPEDGFRDGRPRARRRQRKLDIRLPIGGRGVALEPGSRPSEAFVKFHGERAGSGDIMMRLHESSPPLWPARTAGCAHRRTKSIATSLQDGRAGLQRPAEGQRTKAQLQAASACSFASRSSPPHFIVSRRARRSRGEVQQGKEYQIRPLTPNEYAARLAYALQGAPDDALLHAVADGGRPDLRQALVDDPRAVTLSLPLPTRLSTWSTPRVGDQRTPRSSPRARGSG
jgi:hypothetical protein